MYIYIYILKRLTTRQKSGCGFTSTLSLQWSAPYPTSMATAASAAFCSEESVAGGRNDMYATTANAMHIIAFITKHHPL